MESPSALPTAKRACGPCRRRKIKCEASVPICANCRVSQLSCHYTVPKRRGPKPNKALGGSRRVQSLPEEPTSYLQGSVESPPYPLADAARIPVPPVTPGALSESYSSWAASTPERVAWTPSTLLLAPNVPRAAYGIVAELRSSLKAALPSEPATTIANKCISLYMQYLFSSAPVVHEVTVRASASRFLSGDPVSTENGPGPTYDFANENERLRVAEMRHFTLLTAVCATACFLFPDSYLSYRHQVASPFLRASREMLKLFDEYDAEFPDSSSLTIRMFHSSALQHATGKTGVSWHILGQAGLLAQDLRLYDERSLSKYDPLEAQLLRHIFQQLYTADRSARALKCRPVTLHEALFDSEFTLQPKSVTYIPLLDLEQPQNSQAFEQHLLEGFGLNCRLWRLTASLIQDMEAYARHIPVGDSESIERIASRTRLTEAYFEFATIINGLPLWLRSPEETGTNGDEVSQTQRESYWAHRTSFLITFHCAKLLILRSAIQCGVTAIMGLSDQPLTLAMRQVEIAQDFVDVLVSMPLRFLQVNGEPCVEKIRRVGGYLLEAIHNTDNEMVKSQARSCATCLVDTLARLDSRASDELVRFHSTSEGLSSKG